ncbi:MAG TPA: EamA family transporter, partial [Candidatus Acetothermia bacterium]|nr:EamA family transporter [Candidatus Acetothermia bacterium]
RPRGMTGGQSHRTARGVLFALGTVLTQSLRYLFSKQALGEESLSALSANTVQILAATVSIWLVAFAAGRWKRDLDVLSNPRAAVVTLGGAVAGPFVGVTLSMVALAQARLGVASTLMALPPVLLLPLAVIFFGERVSIRAVAGTIVAVGGVASLFLL